MNRSSTAIVSTPRIFGNWMYRKTAHGDAASMLAAW